ncbi:GNAT family N-acetyltransferase [Erwinia mallotivora]|uniref:GNAT family N-acetyltransferase n=1 Tax=Erwinia mallotivora TaxID=69222 RepID=UPI0021BF3FA0|nr:GNAT family N-acetyltransferase [Erwinia mallotivora]
MDFIKLECEHINEMYSIRFSVTENPVHAHQIQFLQRDQVLEDISYGGGWICKINEQYVGYGLGIRIPHPLIGGLFVRPEYQKMGIGSEILSNITDWFFSSGDEQIELTTDVCSSAVLFYKKRGWFTDGLDEFGQQIMRKRSNGK